MATGTLPLWAFMHVYCQVHVGANAELCACLTVPLPTSILVNKMSLTWPLRKSEEEGWQVLSKQIQCFHANKCSQVYCGVFCMVSLISNRKREAFSCVANTHTVHSSEHSSVDALCALRAPQLERGRGRADGSSTAHIHHCIHHSIAYFMESVQQAWRLPLPYGCRRSLTVSLLLLNDLHECFFSPSLRPQQISPEQSLCLQTACMDENLALVIIDWIEWGVNVSLVDFKEFLKTWL